MTIVILVATAIAATCLAEVARRAYLGRRTVRDMQWHKPPSTIATLLTAQEMQNALRHTNEGERRTTRQAGTRPDHYATVANSVVAINMATQSDVSSTSRAIGAPHR
jgi:hypothetical protein